jgi:CDP-paratose 2-epimerase
MPIVIVTGSAGLVGSETARFFHEKGLSVIGIDNDMRAAFFGPEASTDWNRRKLEQSLPNYRHAHLDIRDEDAVGTLFKRYGTEIELIVHCAAQPSHDWAAKAPITDFTVNANGTLVLLEATRTHCPEATFIHLSTNKVYGDAPNRLPLVETETRYTVDPDHPYSQRGIDEHLSIDHCTHSLFGVSKAAADLLVQEYGRYFDMRTYCFRGGCLTGGGHSGTELHGFLAYLMKCTLEGNPYTVFGYKGKQVRDNIHSHDLVNAFWHVFQNPVCGSRVYNIGGGIHANTSMLEAIDLCQEISGNTLEWSYSDTHRVGDHKWWVSDVRAFQQDHPDWAYEYDLKRTLQDIHDSLRDRDKADFKQSA